MADLIDNSQRLLAMLDRRLANGLNRANESMIKDARSGAPAKSGKMRDDTEVIRDASPSSLEARGASKVEYAVYVNRHHAPFWTAAWIKMKARFGEFFRG